jgi:erythrocyte band 7 integral membrane protein
MTKDNVTLHLNSVIYYRITSPHKAAFGIANIRQALIERTQTTLRHVIGARVLQDVIERREEIAASIREIVEETAAGWGVDVESMLIKDIIFSQELQDSLSMAAQSKRTGEAKVIAARAEVESAKVSIFPPYPTPLKLYKHLHVKFRMVSAPRAILAWLGRIWVKSRVLPSTYP